MTSVDPKKKKKMNKMKWEDRFKQIRILSQRLTRMLVMCRTS